MEPIRLATQEEVEKIKANADIDIGCSILALDGKQGTDFAVIRVCTEVDPVFFDSGTMDSRKALFIWGVENMLRAQGVTHYYFNVKTEDEAWKHIVERWGAKATSESPEIRFKKLL